MDMAGQQGVRSKYSAVELDRSWLLQHNQNVTDPPSRPPPKSKSNPIPIPTRNPKCPKGVSRPNPSGGAPTVRACPDKTRNVAGRQRQGFPGSGGGNTQKQPFWDGCVPGEEEAGCRRSTLSAGLGDLLRCGCNAQGRMGRRVQDSAVAVLHGMAATPVSVCLCVCVSRYSAVIKGGWSVCRSVTALK